LANIIRKVSILGAGSFGTAIAQYIARHADKKKIAVTLYGRDEKSIGDIRKKHENTKRLPGIPLSDRLNATGSLETTLTDCDLAILAVPAQHLRTFLREVTPHLPEKTILLNPAKGIEKTTRKRMSEVISETVGKKRAAQSFASLGGPSFAADIASEKPVGVTLCSRNRVVLNKLYSFLNSPTFDVKITTDEAGLEYGGALKNIFAIAAGIFRGCHLGGSIPGDYFTRSMVEMRDVGMFCGGKWSTFSGRCGLGDLAVTCTESSRNFRFGRIYAEMFNSKKIPQNVAELKNMHNTVFHETIEQLGTRTVEGFDTVEPIYELVERHRIFTPIIRSCYRLLYKRDITPSEMLPTIRAIDIKRKNEGLNVLSILMHELFPRLWYRRMTRRTG